MKSAHNFSISAPRVAGLLLFAAITAFAHDDHSHGHDGGGMAMDMAPETSSAPSSQNTTVTEEIIPTYFRHEEHQYLLLAHIALMILSWVFVLPISVMLTIAKSRLRLPVQIGFLVMNALGVFLSIIYSANTPDLYPGDSHRPVGWIVTWIVGVQMVLALLNAYVSSGNPGQQVGSSSEYAPLNARDLEERRWKEEEADDYRFSDDSGHGIERNTASLRTSSTTTLGDPDAIHDVPLKGDDDSSVFKSRFAEGSFMAQAETAISGLSTRSKKALRFTESTLNRVILFLGYTALLTGITSYGGFFQGSEIFSGLAHWIKGSIFFWYGVLTLGRWAGCFADRGWAWNLAPQTQGSKQPYSAEFVESFLIFFYGSTNVFLEHLAAWGKAWSHTDLEHLAITILFIGGGLCGMLVESTKVRKLLNYAVTKPQQKQQDQQYDMQSFNNSRGQADGIADVDVPPTYKFSLNPLPAITIALLGMLMSSHHQASMVSTMIHAQWGALLMTAALARGATYIILYLKPPSSVLPVRLPTELVAAFCLIAGGTMFCVSAHDTVNALETNGFDAMFAFTITMGVVAALMAWELVVLCVKGWAVKRQVQYEA